MRDGRLFGQLGLSYADTRTISFEDISHRITDLVMKTDGSIEAELEILDTPKGLIAQKIIDGLTTSLRALGEVDRAANVTELEVVTIDLMIIDDNQGIEQEE